MNSARDQKNNINHIIFFDGVCNLCNNFVRIIIRLDRKALFHFSSLQSEFAQNFIDKNHYPTNLETVIYYENGSFHKKSAAVIKIIRHITILSALSTILKYLPTSILDKIYDLVAANRYKIFGQSESCEHTHKNEQTRFL